MHALVCVGPLPPTPLAPHHVAAAVAALWQSAQLAQANACPSLVLYWQLLPSEQAE